MDTLTPSAAVRIVKNAAGGWNVIANGEIVGRYKSKDAAQSHARMIREAR